MSRRYRLVIPAQARSDLAAAKAWLTQPGSGRRSHPRYIDILRALLTLEESPARWPASGHGGQRRRILHGYSLLYSIDEGRQTVTILRIFGPYQDRPDP